MKNSILYDMIIDHIDIPNSFCIPAYELERQLVQLIGELALNAQQPISLGASYELAQEIIHDLAAMGPIHPPALQQVTAHY